MGHVGTLERLDQPLIKVEDIDDDDAEDHYYCCRTDGTVSLCGKDISDIEEFDPATSQNQDCAMCIVVGSTAPANRCPLDGDQCPSINRNYKSTQ